MVGFHVLPDLRRYLYYLIDLTYRSNSSCIVPFQHPTELVVAGSGRSPPRIPQLDVRIHAEGYPQPAHTSPECGRRTGQ